MAVVETRSARRLLRCLVIRRARGERNGNARLTEAKVRAIRWAWAAKLRNKSQLAREHKVCWTVIDRIVRGEAWQGAGDALFVDGLDA